MVSLSGDHGRWPDDYPDARKQPGDLHVIPLSPNSRSRGFSLVEVMVAVIVICVGLLGIAKLQALSLSNTTTSRLRALAAIQVASVAAAMHSNRQYWGNTPPNTVTVTGTAITSTDPALQTQATTDLTGTSPSICSSPPSTSPDGACRSRPCCPIRPLRSAVLPRRAEDPPAAPSRSPGSSRRCRSTSRKRPPR
ncbi:MAG: prepilin-type N-terminal cleavage/methylation domain-containing protein [Gammaproteobacteria bacterium]|nr:MAG: prepilin-type N-terminal cleavage/methylation domain-containing protein [Gammaproteobacteria bacterium]